MKIKPVNDKEVKASINEENGKQSINMGNTVLKAGDVLQVINRWD